MQTFCFSVVLWGRPFVELFTRYVLPSQLAPQNLPALGLGADDEYVIVTTAADMEHMQRTPAVARLAELVRIKWVLGSFGEADVRSTVKYEWMTEAHKFVIGYARERDAGIWFLTPDTILSDGSIGRVAAAARAGRRAVMVTGLMVDRTRFLPALHAHLEREGRTGELDAGTLGIGPRRVMEMATRSYHHIVDAYRWDSMRFNRFPSFVYWSLGDAGMLVRCFHLHPIYIHPEDWDAPIFTEGFATIDQTYTARAIRDLDRIYIPTDSDEFLLLELAPPEKQYPVYDRSFAAPRRIGAWAARETEVLNWTFFKHRLWYHTGVDRGRFATIERESDRFVDEVLTHAVVVRREIDARRRVGTAPAA